MKFNKKLILIFIVFCTSCTVSNNEIPGVYIFKNEYIIDSLVVMNNHSYRREIFSTNDSRLLYSQNEKWSYSDKILELENFLNKMGNGINIINSKETNFKYPVIDTNFNPNKTIFGNIVFEIDRYNYYYKTSKLVN